MDIKNNLMLGLMLLLGGVFYYYSRHIESNNKDTSTIIVGTSADYPPYEYIDGEDVVGFDISLIKAIAQKLERPVEIKNMSFESLLIEIQRGTIHTIASMMNVTPERATKIFFTTPYVDNDELILISLKDNQYDNLTALQGKEVLVNDGFSAEKYMTEQEGIVIKRIGTVAEAFLALTMKKSDAYVVTECAAQDYFRLYGRNKFNIISLGVAESVAFGISKKHPELFTAINNILKEFKIDGTLQRLKEKWGIV
jgi:ABC-type amino acid transport substrate-binding protein